MSKNIAEHQNALSVFWLKKHKYLDKDHSFKTGGIAWTYGDSTENKNSISFSVIRHDFCTENEKAYINLRYTNTNRISGDKEDMDYNVDLTTTPCRYGGKRYWFICPLSKNGITCGKRVGVLFVTGKWFGCRHCADIAYVKQMDGGKYRWLGVSIPDVERAEKDVKRLYYRGKPTRKFRRLLRLEGKLEEGLRTMIKSMDRYKKK